MAVTYVRKFSLKLDTYRSAIFFANQYVLLAPITTKNKLQKFDLLNSQICWELEPGNVFVFDDFFWISNTDQKMLWLASFENGEILTKIPLEGDQRVIGYHKNNPIIRRGYKPEYNYQCLDMSSNILWEKSSSLDIWEISVNKMLWASIQSSNHSEAKEFRKIEHINLREAWRINSIELYHEQVNNNILQEDFKFPYYYNQNRVFNDHLLIDIGHREKFGDCTYLSSINVNTGELEWFSEERDVLNFKVIEDDIVLCRKGEIVIIDLHTGITKKKGPIQTNGMQLDTRECNRFTIKDGLMYVCFNNFAGMRSIGVVEMEHFNVLWYEDVEGPGAYRRYTLFDPMIIGNDIYVIDSEHNLLSWERIH